MGIGPLVNLASGYIQSLISSATSKVTTTASSATTGTTGVQDTNQLSSFAQVLNSLQQLQQSNQSQYQQVTQQISGNLQSGAQSATASGNTALASQLTQLSTDFKNASTSGQLPNIQDLAQAIGGGHHHHRGAPSGNVSQFVQSLNATANTSQSAQSIIDGTLSNAGIPLS